MENQGESSSSNDINQKAEKSEETKEEEPEKKKSKQDESAKNTQEQEQNDTAGTSINDLPTEMLMKILKHVDDKNLIACRLLNRNWREISTEILSARNQIELQFAFDETKKIFKQKKVEVRSLGDFVECFKDTKKCFYTRFLFRFYLYSSPSKFENEDWLKFLSYIKDSIKCLKLVVGPNGSNSIVTLSESLSDLLLNKIPQLEEFGLTFSSTQGFRSSVQLFPPTKESVATTSTTNTTTAETTQTTITTRTVTMLPLVELPHLKILHLSEVLFSTCSGIVDDLLKAAVNLKSIKDFGEHHSDCKKFLKPQDYIFLHSRGKLNLLEEAEIKPSVQLFSAFKENTLAFKLKKLELTLSSIYKEVHDDEDASTFISRLFESCKDTLTDLTMDPVGFLPQVKFPRFTKLQRFTVESTSDSTIFEPVFPPGINSLEVFPVLHTLELNVDWIRNFPEENNILLFPTVKSLLVSDWKLTGSCIRKMSLMFTNLKDFSINSVYDEDYNVNFPEVGRAIWTHMKQLQSLDLKIDLKSDFNTGHALDSCFTGISVKNCKRLYELMKAQKYFKRWNTKSNVAKSEFKTPVRENVSILALKDLKNLNIKVEWYLGDRESAKNVLKRSLTRVSEICAFKRMKNLKYYIDKDVEF